MFLLRILNAATMVLGQNRPQGTFRKCENVLFLFFHEEDLLADSFFRCRMLHIFYEIFQFIDIISLFPPKKSATMHD